MIIIEKLYNLSLSVDDLDSAVSFYKDIFGFDVVEWQSGSSEVSMLMGDIKLRLCQVEELPENNREENYLTFYVDEDDFDDALDEIDHNELEIVFGPENVRNGRRIVIKDPFDNKVGLCSVSR